MSFLPHTLSCCPSGHVTSEHLTSTVDHATKDFDFVYITTIQYTDYSDHLHHIRCNLSRTTSVPVTELTEKACAHMGQHVCHSSPQFDACRRPAVLHTLLQWYSHLREHLLPTYPLCW